MGEFMILAFKYFLPIVTDAIRAHQAANGPTSMPTNAEIEAHFRAHLQESIRKDQAALDQIRD